MSPKPRGSSGTASMRDLAHGAAREVVGGGVRQRVAGQQTVVVLQGQPVAPRAEVPLGLGPQLRFRDREQTRAGSQQKDQEDRSLHYVRG